MHLQSRNLDHIHPRIVASPSKRSTASCVAACSSDLHLQYPTNIRVMRTGCVSNGSMHPKASGLWRLSLVSWMNWKESARSGQNYLYNIEPCHDYRFPDAQYYVIAIHSPSAILILKNLPGINDPKQQKNKIAIAFLKKYVTFVNYILLIICVIFNPASPQVL